MTNLRLNDLFRMHIGITGKLLISGRLMSIICIRSFMINMV